MPFKKGVTTNPKGREVGSKNKKTLLKEQAQKAGLDAVRLLAEAYEVGLNDECITLVKDFFDPSLTARDRLHFYNKLTEYLYPKQRSTTVDLTAKTTTARELEQKLKELADGDTTEK